VHAQHSSTRKKDKAEPTARESADNRSADRRFRNRSVGFEAALLPWSEGLTSPICDSKGLAFAGNGYSPDTCRTVIDSVANTFAALIIAEMHARAAACSGMMAKWQPEKLIDKSIDRW
jgi:hypothetical protein